jgi:serine/threonine-protein kinase
MELLDLTGKTIDGFEILTELGRGGMGVVYRAREQSLNRLVALKVLSPTLSANPEFVERFRREAQVVAGLVHPNIVPIYAIGESRGLLYFTMEYVDGVSLRDYLKKHGVLSPFLAVKIAVQAASALSVAHAAGIIHRDIKPRNIMIDRTGRVRVMDFGLAKRVEEATAGLTAEGSFLGTLRYASPEQFEGGPLDGRTDLYALGLVLYEMLVGQLPFDSDSSTAMIRQKLLGDLRPLGGGVRERIPELYETVHRLIARQPSDRFPNAQELVDALKRIAQKLTADRWAGEAPTLSLAIEPASGDAVGTRSSVCAPPSAVFGAPQSPEGGMAPSADASLSPAVQPGPHAQASGRLPASRGARLALYAVAAFVLLVLAPFALPGVRSALLAPSVVEGEMLFAPSSKTASEPIPGQLIHLIPSGSYAAIRGEVATTRDRTLADLRTSETERLREYASEVDRVESEIARFREHLIGLSDLADMEADIPVRQARLAEIERQYESFKAPGWRSFLFKADGGNTTVYSSQRQEYDRRFQEILSRLRQDLGSLTEKRDRLAQVIGLPPDRPLDWQAVETEKQAKIRELESEKAARKQEMEEYRLGHAARVRQTAEAALALLSGKLGAAAGAKTLKTNSQGRFSFEKPKGTYVLVALRIREEAAEGEKTEEPEILFWECRPQRSRKTVAIDNGNLVPRREDPPLQPGP